MSGEGVEVRVRVGARARVRVKLTALTSRSGSCGRLLLNRPSQSREPTQKRASSGLAARSVRTT